jgi:hypothetical protein
VEESSGGNPGLLGRAWNALMDPWGAGKAAGQATEELAAEKLDADRELNAAQRSNALAIQGTTNLREGDAEQYAGGGGNAVRKGVAVFGGAAVAVTVAGGLEAAKAWLENQAAKAVGAVVGAGTRLKRAIKGPPKVRPRASPGTASTRQQRRLLRAPRTAAEWRETPGLASGGGDLPEVTGRWLRGTEGNARKIPAQIASRLRGRSFNSWKEFRAAFWKEVAADPDFSSQFSTANQKLMTGGKAPFVTPGQVTGLGRNQQVYNLHHIKAIEEGGAVYDLDNIAVVTPAYHDAF